MTFYKNIILKSTSFEKWNAVVSLVLAVAVGLNGNDRPITILILVSCFVISVLILIFQMTRSSFVIYGYHPVLEYLELLATNAEKRIWTVRTHIGKGDTEKKYFDTIQHKLRNPDKNKKVDDFRRIIRLSSNSKNHLNYLVNQFSELSNVEVRYYIEGGPKFDFLIIDEIAVIGFPMVGGRNNTGAIVIRERSAVDGVKTVFYDLLSPENSELLFLGNENITHEEKRDLIKSIDNLLINKIPKS